MTNHIYITIGLQEATWSKKENKKEEDNKLHSYSSSHSIQDH